MKTSMAVILTLCTAALLAPTAQGQGAKKVTVKITSPTKGATVTSPVLVKLTATGVRIAPATVEEPGTGHHHLCSSSIPSHRARIG